MNRYLTTVFRSLSLSVLFLVVFLSFANAQEAPVDFPERHEPELREGFENPPIGYGEVPFWWWTGEKLDVERLNWQLDELKKKGIPGVQVNYAHQDVRNDVQPNWLTYPNEPEVLSDEWFSVFDQVREHCRELNMGIGVSGYTLDWQNSPGNLFDRLIYSDPELQSRSIYVDKRIDVKSGENLSEVLKRTLAFKDDSQKDDLIGVVAYWDRDFGDCVLLGRSADGLDLSTESARDCQVWIYRAKRVEHTLNPLHPDSGKRVVERFFQPFEDRAKASLKTGQDDKSTLGLEYFFQDELQLGTGELIWTDDLEEQFESRKGYSLWKALPAMFGVDCGDLTEKYRLDFMDVRVRLAEERYFIPIYNWNARRGRIYACDPGSRGKNPSEFCDYFSAIRWYTAPGHDTPGGNADFIKNKVSSSIAHFYNRPRVWLEGYHSFGWGATPERLLFATNENFLFGANLLNLHGLYYTTYGGYWEWAPPCYHFRQPYWETFGSFLKYFERLSFALTRGVEQPDFVVLYPVSSYQSRLGGDRARDVAFEAARRIFNSGHDVLFIDDDSIARAKIADGRLNVAGAGHRVLVLPSTRGIRFKTLCKARDFCKAGGVVVVLDALPEATDNGGRSDVDLKATLDELFDGGRKAESIVTVENGGVAAFFSPRSDRSDVDGDKKGSNNTISKLRRYPGGFEGHWVWSEKLEQDVRFKWIVSGLTDETKEYQALLFCDNAGTMYVNGQRICSGANYSDGWRGAVALRNGDVVTIDGHDDDTPRRGSAGMFFALVDGDKTIVSAEVFRCEAGRSDEAWRKSSGNFDKLAVVDVGNVHVLHRTGVNTEQGGSAAVTSDGDDSVMWARFGAFLEQFPRDVVDAQTGKPCSAMKRATSDADIFFVMKGKKGATLTFRSSGRAELFNAWDGTRREVPATIQTTSDGQRTVSINWPYDENQAGLVVFWRNEEPNENLSDDSPKRSGSGVKQALDGEWGFRLTPTLNNRWGDFRLPIHDETMGVEAQRFNVCVDGKETKKNALNDFGPKYLVLGPFPTDADFASIEAKLLAEKKIAPHASTNLLGRDYEWKVGSFSWRWGVEGNPGHEGYHGLKEKIDSRFIALGKLVDGFNEKNYKPEEEGSVYYLWTTAPVSFKGEKLSEEARIVDVYAGGDVPGAIWVDGRRIEFGDDTIVSTPDVYSPVLLRYDSAGRRSCVFVERGKDGARDATKLVNAEGLDHGAYNGLATGLREETPDFVVVPEKRTPLSTVWFDVPGVLDYDVYGGDDQTPRRLSFVAPPGLSELKITTCGIFSGVYVDGVELKATSEVRNIPGWEYWRGLSKVERFGANVPEDPTTLSDQSLSIVSVKLAKTLEREATVEVELTPVPGVYDAALCPEPIRLTCEAGVTTLGNWNERGVLSNYSGGARYTKRFNWTATPGEGERTTLDLGSVGASCRVWLNGEQIAELPTPPWTVDVTDKLVVGFNTLEIDVYNTAANFYSNIPTRYGGAPASGLMGPVELRVEPAERRVSSEIP